jgi:hypothetical protein
VVHTHAPWKAYWTSYPYFCEDGGQWAESPPSDACVASNEGTGLIIFTDDPNAPATNIEITRELDPVSCN